MRFRSAFVMQVAAAVVPSIVLLVVVPVVRRTLSLQEFASFTVLISSVSVLTLFDGGIGRGATYFISRARADTSADNATLGWISACLLLGLGFSSVVAAGGALALHWSGGALGAAQSALFVLLVFSPAFVLGSVLKGAIEGERRFAVSTLIQLAYGCAIGAAPLALLQGAHKLSSFSLVVGATRVVLVIMLLIATVLCNANQSWHAQPGMLLPKASRVFRYVRWLMISNVVGLCIIFADRFAIATYFDAQVVASYILPMEMISRLQLLVAAFCSVLFPSLVVRAQQEKRDYFRAIGSAQGLIASFVMVGGCLGLLIAEPMFNWWLGPQLGRQAAQIALVSFIGVALIANAAVAMVAINSLGHTRQIAVLHIAELIVYLMLLYAAAMRQSVVLLLLAWLARQLIDAIVMTWILHGLKHRFEGIAARPAVPASALPWALLVGMYIMYIGLAFNLQHLGAACRILAAVTGGAIAALIGKKFYIRLKDTMRLAQREAVA